jgi:hypothetical protein
MAGIPHMSFTITSSSSAPWAYFGIGIQRAGSRKFELLDEQVFPIQGTGAFDADLGGVSANLGKGDVVGGFSPLLLAVEGSFCPHLSRVRRWGVNPNDQRAAAGWQLDFAALSTNLRVGSSQAPLGVFGASSLIPVPSPGGRKGARNERAVQPMKRLCVLPSMA